MNTKPVKVQYVKDDGDKEWTYIYLDKDDKELFRETSRSRLTVDEIRKRYPTVNTFQLA